MAKINICATAHFKEVRKMQEQSSPYICHIFVCTNDRQGKRKSCADGESNDVRSALKEEGKKRGWAGKVRVSQCGCMGLCEMGPNVVLYPQKIHFSEVTAEDIPDILKKAEEILKENSNE